MMLRPEATCFRRGPRGSLFEATQWLIDDMLFEKVIARVAQHYNPSAVCVVLEGPEHLHVKAAHGMRTGTFPFSSITNHVSGRPLPIIICDARDDERFVKDSLVVGPPYTRFYVGAPIIVHGICVGSICLLDSNPRCECTLDDCDIIVEAASEIADQLTEVNTEAEGRTTVGSLPCAEELNDLDSEAEWSEASSNLGSRQHSMMSS